MRTPLLLLALLVTMSSGLPLLHAARAQEDPSDDTPFLEGETQESAQPPLRVTRPSDSWQFVDLERARTQAQARGEDISGYKTLRFRLWYGAARSNIFVHAWVDEVVRDGPPDPEVLARGMVEGLKSHLEGMKVKAFGRGRVGRRVGALFEVQGKNVRQGKDVAILRAVVYRPEDRAIVTVALECPAEEVDKVRKDFKALLRKLRV